MLFDRSDFIRKPGHFAAIAIVMGDLKLLLLRVHIVSIVRYACMVHIAPIWQQSYSAGRDESLSNQLEENNEIIYFIHAKLVVPQSIKEPETVGFASLNGSSFLKSNSP